MIYETPKALRMALEQRLLNQSNQSGVSLDRLRRRVVFERVVARLAIAEPDRWVLKGGMALEVRLRDQARLTKDIDLGLRDDVDDGAELHERLVEALVSDPFADRFELAAGPVVRLEADGAGHVTWRSKVEADLAGSRFGRVQLDVSPRAHELTATERVALPNSLAFAGVDSPTIEIIDVNRHAAEKLHALFRDYGDRDNTRVRDLVDVVILHEQQQLDRSALAHAIKAVWKERDGMTPPGTAPPFPDSWPERYEQLAEEHDLATASFPDAVEVVIGLWADISTEED